VLGSIAVIYIIIAIGVVATALKSRGGGQSKLTLPQIGGGMLISDLAIAISRCSLGWCGRQGHAEAAPKRRSL